MAELTTESTPTSDCCAPEAQASCCEQSEKDECCGTTTAAAGCGCAAGQTAEVATGPEDIRETVREKYAAAARAVTEQQGSASCCGPISLTDADETHVFGAALYDGRGGRRRDRERSRRVARVRRPDRGRRPARRRDGAGPRVRRRRGRADQRAARRADRQGDRPGHDRRDARARTRQRRAGRRRATSSSSRGSSRTSRSPTRSVDVIVSNCVLNLSGDKPKVLAEAARVLKPGGRFAVSDVIASPNMDEATRADLAAYTGCIAGALTEDAVPRRASRPRGSPTSRSARPTACTSTRPRRSSAPASPEPHFLPQHLAGRSPLKP